MWGVGGHAQRTLIPALAAAENADLVALFTRDPSIREDVAAATGAVPYSNPGDLLDDPDVDAIYIATPTGLHTEMSMEVIAAGKHVWCEKPMSVTYDQTAAIVDAAMGAGLVALEADMFLHHPQFRKLKRLVSSDGLGPLASVTARFGFPHRDRNDFRYSAQLGGGALLDAGYYPIAAAVDLFGPGLNLAGCTIGHDVGRGVDIGGTAIAVTDHRAAVLDWGFGRSYRSEIEVWCEDAVVEATRAFSKPADLETELVIRHQSGEVETIAIAAADQFALMVDDFADVTVGNSVFDPTPQLERARLLSEIRNTAV